MDAPPATMEIHILKNRDIWWTVEWDDHGKVRRAAAHAPNDEVPPPPRGGDRLRLAARVPHTPRIVDREVEVRWGLVDGASPEVCESWVVACRRLFDDGGCPLGWRPHLLNHGGNGVGDRCEVRADAWLVLLVVLGHLLARGGATIGCSPFACYCGGGVLGHGGWTWWSSAAPRWRVRVYAHTPRGGRCPGVGLSRGGGRLGGVTGEGGPV